MKKKPGPKPKPDHLRKVRVSFACSPTVWEKASKYAEKTGQSTSQVVEEVLKVKFG